MSIILGQQIHKTYQDGTEQHEVLRGVDIAVEAGEFIAIVGRSGAGKSTLLYQLSALDVPTSGEVFIDQQNVLQMDADTLADFRLRTLGYVFQDYALIPDLTAIENVSTPLLMRGIGWEQANELARAALESVGLIGRGGNLPAQLSGGEQQRVAIARAVAGRPKILFADEPTANLDSVSGRVVIDLLGQLHESGQTIVMVTHEDEYTKQCDRVIHLEDGLVTAVTQPVATAPDTTTQL